jgi:tryptophan-rich sensory protein
MRFAIVFSALFATLAIAGPVMFEKRDKSECCCYQGGTYCVRLHSGLFFFFGQRFQLT